MPRNICLPQAAQFQFSAGRHHQTQPNKAFNQVCEPLNTISHHGLLIRYRNPQISGATFLIFTLYPNR